jgi:hypothetical protein
MYSSWVRRAMGIFILAAAASSSACFIGYDSRWGQAKQAQEHRAESLRPATLAAVGGGVELDAAKPLKARVWANARYVSQTVDWQHDFRGIVEDANRVLAGGVGARIEIAGMERWEDAAPDESLDAQMSALKEQDPGRDAAWVIGLVGGLPTATARYHELGLATVWGHHIVLRSARDLLEQEAIEKSLAELSVDARTELIRQRRRHRSTAVLLHEIGHTLGLIHQTGKDQLMLPAYSSKVDGFGEIALALARKSVAHRIAADDAAASLRDAFEIYSAPSPTADWVESERVEWVARLAAYAPPAAGARAAGTPAAAIKPATPAVLSPAHAALWAQSHALSASGDPRGAATIAAPLFSSYPDDYEVQDYRCTLAMAGGVSMDELRAACAAIKRITMAKPSR